MGTLKLDLLDPLIIFLVLGAFIILSLFGLAVLVLALLPVFVLGAILGTPFLSVNFV